MKNFNEWLNDKDYSETPWQWQHKRWQRVEEPIKPGDEYKSIKIPFSLNSFLRLIGRKGRLFPRIYCNDGFSLSVQAGASSYSEPRSNVGPYSEVEVGYPSKPEQDLMPYIEQGSDSPTESVYPYVPVEVVEKVIEKHAGLNWSKMGLK